MPLSSDERDLLRRIGQSPGPAAMSDFFEFMNPAFPGLTEEHPEHEAWTERQIALYEVSVSLWRQGLVRVVHPANGLRPDLVELSDEGTAALSATPEGERTT